MYILLLKVKIVPSSIDGQKEKTNMKTDVKNLKVKKENKAHKSILARIIELFGRSSSVCYIDDDGSIYFFKGY